MHARKIGKSYFSITGWVSLGQGRPPAEFESTLERDYYILRSVDPALENIYHQPITIWYEHEGKSRRYTPDALLVPWPDARGQGLRPRLEEVKPTEHLEKYAADFGPAFEAARAYAHAQGWDFNIVTERDIRGVTLDNVARLRRYRSKGNDVDPAIAEPMIAKLRDGGELTIGELILGVPEIFGGDAIRQVWILLAHGALATDMTTALSRRSTVKLTTGYTLAPDLPLARAGD